MPAFGGKMPSKTQMVKTLFSFKILTYKRYPTWLNSLPFNFILKLSSNIRYQLEKEKENNTVSQ